MGTFLIILFIIVLILAVANSSNKEKNPKTATAFPANYDRDIISSLAPKNNVVLENEPIYDEQMEVAGPQHYLVDGFLKISEYEQVFLLPEDNNKFDRNAIRVINSYGETIGYIPKQNAGEIKAHLDNGNKAEVWANVLSATDFITIDLNVQIYEE